MLSPGPHPYWESGTAFIAVSTVKAFGALQVLCLSVYSKNTPFPLRGKILGIAFLLPPLPLK